MALPSEMYGEFLRKRINQTKQQINNAPARTPYSPPSLDSIYGPLSNSNTGGSVNAPSNLPRNFKPTPLTEGDKRDAEIKAMDERGDFWGATGARLSKGFNDTVNQPVIQGLLDALSVGGYVTANIGEEMTKSAERGAGPLDYVGDVFQGVGRGLSGAAGNKNDTTTWADNFNRWDYNANKRTSAEAGQESDERALEENMANGTAGKAIGGLAGDILLDPLTYVGVGLIKGVGKGAQAAGKFSSGAKLSRAAAIASNSSDSSIATDKIAQSVRGLETDDFKAFVRENGKTHVKPTARRTEMARLVDEYRVANPGKSPYNEASSRMEAFRGGYNQSIDDFRDSIIQGRNYRKVKRQAKKLDRNANPAVMRRHVETNLSGLKVTTAKDILSKANVSEGMGKVAADAKASEDYAEIVRSLDSPDPINWDALSPVGSVAKVNAEEMDLGTQQALDFLTGTGRTEAPDQRAITEYFTEMKSQGLDTAVIQQRLARRFPDITRHAVIDETGNLQFNTGGSQVRNQGALIPRADIEAAQADGVVPETPVETPGTGDLPASQTGDVPESVPDENAVNSIEDTVPHNEAADPTNPPQGTTAETAPDEYEATVNAKNEVAEIVESVPEFKDIKLRFENKLTRVEQVYVELADITVPTGAYKYSQDTADSVKEYVAKVTSDREAAIKANEAAAKFNASLAAKSRPKKKTTRLKGEEDAIASNRLSYTKIDPSLAAKSAEEAQANLKHLETIGANVDFTDISLWENIENLAESFRAVNYRNGKKFTPGDAKAMQTRHVVSFANAIEDIVNDKANALKKDLLNKTDDMETQRVRAQEGADISNVEIGRAQYGGILQKDAIEKIKNDLGVDLANPSDVINRVFRKSVKGMPDPRTRGIGLAIDDKFSQPYLIDLFGRYQKSVDDAVDVAEDAKPMEMVDVPSIGHDDLRDMFGIRPEDYALALEGKLPVGAAGKESGALRDISKAIRNGNIAEDLVQRLGEILGFDGNGSINKFVASELNKFDGPVYKKVKDNFEFAWKSGFLVNQNRGGAGALKLISDMKGMNKQDLLPMFRPASKEDGIEYYRQKGEVAQNNIAVITGNPAIDESIYKKADSVLKKMVRYQTDVSQLPKRSKTGAAVSEAEDTARYVNQFNTFAQVNYASEAMRWVKDNNKGFGKALSDAGLKGKAKTNAQIAAVRNMMILMESKARQLGVDIHLANFAPKFGDEAVLKENPLVVRLSVGDAMEILPNKILEKTLFGVPFMKPTELLDIIEVGVRTMTRLTPDGHIDMDHVKTMILSASKGTMGNGVKMGGHHTHAGRESMGNDIFNLDGTLIRALYSASKKDPEIKAAYNALKEKNLPIENYSQKVDFLNYTLGAERFGGSAVSKILEDYSNDYLVKIVDDLLSVGEDGLSPMVKFVERSIDNASAMNARIIDRAFKAKDEYYEALLSADTLGRKLTVISNKPKVDMADDGKSFMDDLLAGVDEVLAKVNPPTASKFDDLMKRVEKQVNADDLVKAVPTAADTAKFAAVDATSNMDMATLQLKNALDPELPQAVRQEEAYTVAEDLFDTAYMSVTQDTIKKMAPISQFFDSAFGTDVWRQINQTSHATSHLMNDFHKVINKWNKSGLHGQRLNTAFKGIQTKRLSEVTEGSKVEFTADEQEVNRLVNLIFDPSHNNFFTRNGIGPRLFNEQMEKTFTKEGSRRYTIKDVENFTQRDWATMWTEWDVDDPGKFLESFFHGFLELSNNLAIGGQFSKFGRLKPPVGEEGMWKRFSYPENNDVTFLKLIDNDLYYPVDFLQQVPYIENLMQKSRTIDKEWVKRTWDPVMSMLKGYQTTAKPGHHVMSVIGDLWRNSIAGMGTSGKEYKEALAILRKNGHIPIRVGDNDPLDELAITFDQMMGTNTVDSKDAIEFVVSPKDRRRVSYKDLHAEMKRQGVILPPHLGGAAEDFLTDFASKDALASDKTFYKSVAKVTTAMDKPLNNSKWSLNQFSAYRDSTMRGALYINQLRKEMVKAGGDLSLASERAANHVKKWAPLANDLGAGESKYLRRAFYFYTWLRGITPRIIEFTATRPGMVTAASKAQYNAALANGIEYESFGVPFPEEEKPHFASWYKEGVLGPQWTDHLGDFMGLNPTHPVLDVFNSLGSGISRGDITGESPSEGAIAKFGNTLLGMTSPMLRSLPEMAGGHRLDSGAPIESNTQYLLDYFMPAKELSKATGMTLSPGGIARRTESKYADNARTDEEIQRDLGIQAMNFLTGSGVTNYSSGEKSAQFEERDALRQQRDYEDRFK